MAVMENPENSFNLSYNQRTDVCLVRQGSREEPIPGLRCMNYSEFLTTQMRGKDFLLDDNGQIMIEQSSGLSTFSTEGEMAKGLAVKPKRLWKIRPGTPFPSEMRINYNPSSGHASIKPATGVSPERFFKMLNCLHWVKIYP